MRRLSWTIVLGILVLLAAAPRAGAVGMGFYLGFGGGEAEWTLEDDFGDEYDVDADDGHVTFGFVLDTAVGSRSVFNYRLNLGLDSFASDLEDRGDDYDWKLGGVVIDNAFGFAIVRAPGVRVWLGPQLRLAAYGGHPEDDDDTDISLVGIGFGPVFGVNLNLGPVVTLAMDTGFRWVYYDGEVDPDVGENYDVYGPESMAFINFSMLFRAGERY